METKKMNYNDNFSDFLTEYNSKDFQKINWINDKLLIIDKYLDDINLPNNNIEIDNLRNVLRNTDIDVLNKVFLSLKEFAELASKENNNLTISYMRPIITNYIEIAKITSNEKIAAEIINIIKNIILK